MAHHEQARFLETVRDCFPGFFTATAVVDIGAYDVNGSGRTQFTSPKAYVGVDLIAGPGVDVVVSGHEYDSARHGQGPFDIAVSFEMFEHNPYWLETFVNMLRITRPGGMILFTCASRGRREHGTSRTSPAASPGTSHLKMDYYRNLNRQDFEQRIGFANHFQEWRFFFEPTSRTLFFAGVKKDDPSAPANALKQQFAELEAKVRDFITRNAAQARQEMSLKRWLRGKLFNLLSWILSDALFREIRRRHSK